MPVSLASLLFDARDIGVRVSNAATDIVFSDRGGCVQKTNASTPTWTVTSDAVGGWDRNVAVIAANDGTSGAVTISPGAGVTLIAGTTSGAFSLPAGESRLLHRVAANSWRVR